MKKYGKMVVFGFLTWLVPFVVSFFFYSPAGVLLIEERFFKSIMIVVGAATGAWLLTVYFKKAESYLAEGVTIGLVWLAMNIALDATILIPMSGMSIGAYATQIGLRYLTMPIMSTAMGYALARARP